jgi:hypothetical protein
MHFARPFRRSPKCWPCLRKSFGVYKAKANLKCPKAIESNAKQKQQMDESLQKGKLWQIDFVRQRSLLGEF